MISVPNLYRLFATLTICFATVATPVLVRSLVDGIIPTKDLYVIGWTLAVLAFTELINIIVQYQLNNDLDELEGTTLDKMRGDLISKIFENHKLILDQHKFLDVWSGDLPKYVYQKKKSHWYRFKDGVMIFLLSLICINISYLAGLIVLGLFVIILFNTAISNKDQNALFSKTFSLRDKERGFFNYVLEKFSEIKDLNRFESYNENIKSILIEIHDAKLSQANQRSEQQRMNALVRFFMIFGVLSLGSILYAQNELSMGSLWSLMITIYRLNGPVQSYSRWIMNLKSERGLADRIDKLFLNVSSPAIEKPKFYNKISKILDDVVNLRGTYLVHFSEEYSEEEIKNAIRYWKSRSSKKDSIFILSNNEPIIPDQICIRFAFTGDLVEGNLVIARVGKGRDAIFDYVVSL